VKPGGRGEGGSNYGLNKSLGRWPTSLIPSNWGPGKAIVVMEALVSGPKGPPNAVPDNPAAHNASSPPGPPWVETTTRS